MDRISMITTEQAIKIIRDSVPSLGTEVIEYTDALTRVLAENIFSDSDFPPFNRSSVDGYACKNVDLNKPLRVIEEIPAGKSPSKAITAGECAKIMTGAELPEGADIVIMKEDVISLNNYTIRYTGKGPAYAGSNFSIKGSDLKTGDLIIREGLIIRPDHIAVLAGVGKIRVKVYKKPSVALITTGSEVIDPEFSPLTKAFIRNSNGPQLKVQLIKIGLKADDSGIVKDDYEEIKYRIINTLEDHDLIIISGGVSVGDYDFVPKILEELGFSFLFRKISSKPGKHTILAKKENRYIFCLPGNPVSSFIQFEVLGKPLIYKLMGTDFKPVRFSVKLSEDYIRLYSDRSEIIPVRINEEGKAELLPYHGSAHIQALAYADALMEIPLGVSEINQGEKVYVRPL